MRGLQVKRCVRVCLELQDYLKNIKEEYGYDGGFGMLSTKKLVSELEEISRCEMDEEEC